MTASNTYLAVFLGDGASPKLAAWAALPEAERRAREAQGIAAWKAWAAAHVADIVEMGGPVGKTKKVADDGVSDIRNEIGGFTIVRASSHEAAAKMFERHPHFTHFPGDRIEIMPIMPIPPG